MSFDHLQENQWGAVTVTSGAYHRANARMVWQEHGGHIHAYAKFRAGGKVLMVHASTDVAAMEREMEPEARRLLLDAAHAHGVRPAPGHQTVESSGWFKRRFRKVRNKLKKIAKKTGVLKVLKTIHKTVEKALDNPLVQAALASNPYGAAFLAARKATKMAFKAIKGSVKSKGRLGQLLKLAKGGNLKAKNILRFVKKQVQLNPKMFKNAQQYASMVKTSGDEMRDLETFVHGCTAPAYATSGGIEIMGDYNIAGDDADGTTDQEIDAVEHFATSGSFEGMRWLAGRLSLHSMAQHPDEMSSRQALSSGRNLQAARFAH